MQMCTCNGPWEGSFLFLFLFNLSNFYLLDTMYAFKLLQQIYLQSIYF